MVWNRAWLSRALAVLVVVYGIVFYAVGAAIKPGYSSASSFISELNATGTAWADALLGAALISVAWWMLDSEPVPQEQP